MCRCGGDDCTGLQRGFRLFVVEAFLAVWLAHMRGRVRRVTFEGYEVLLRRHAFPVLGELKLAALSPLQLQDQAQRPAEHDRDAVALVVADRQLLRCLAHVARQASAGGPSPPRPDWRGRPYPAAPQGSRHRRPHQAPVAASPSQPQADGIPCLIRQHSNLGGIGHRMLCFYAPNTQTQRVS